MPDMRSVAQALRARAERGATREQLEAELRGEGTLSRLERTVLETYVWALTKVAARTTDGGGGNGGSRQ
jgi:hypothetical protein